MTLFSRCYCVAHDFSGQAHFHHTLSNRGQVGVSQLIQHMDHEVLKLKLKVGCAAFTALRRVGRFYPCPQ